MIYLSSSKAANVKSASVSVTVSCSLAKDTFSKSLLCVIDELVTSNDSRFCLATAVSNDESSEFSNPFAMNIFVTSVSAVGKDPTQTPDTSSTAETVKFVPPAETVSTLLKIILSPSDGLL